MSFKVWASQDDFYAADLNQNFSDVLGINVYNENLTAYVTGSADEFVTTESYVPTTLRIYLSDGATGSLNRLMPGGSYDYTETLTGGVGTGFKILAIPTAGSKLLVDYRKTTT